MNVALYPRVSTQEQAINGHSIDEQTDRMKNYCTAMGWSVYKVYTDAGFSGGNMDRPGLKAMIEDVKAGRIDKVVVYKLDRLSRSQLDTLYIIEKVFLANNTDFVSMSESFDTSTPFGRASIGILAVFAQLEREQIKERMIMGKAARAKQGKFGGSNRVPIGYDYIGGELVTNEYEKMQVIKIFELYRAGASQRNIVESMTAAGHRHKYGKWTPRTIHRILSSKTYLGYVVYHDEWYKGDHEAFISQKLYEEVQEIIIQRKEEYEKYNRRHGKASTYLGGYIVCNCCGRKYEKNTSGKRRKDGSYKMNTYYSCRSRIARNRLTDIDPNCKNKSWRVDALDALVFGEIKKLSLDPDYKPGNRPSRQEDQRPGIIRQEIAKKAQQIEKLIDLYSCGEIPQDMLQDRIRAVNDEKGKLEKELQEIEKEVSKKLSSADALRLAGSFSDILDRGNIDEIRQVIGALIDRIVIDNEDVIIYWRFS